VGEPIGEWVGRGGKPITEVKGEIAAGVREGQGGVMVKTEVKKTTPSGGEEKEA